MIQVSDDSLLDRMHELRVAGVPFVVATVIGTRGSTPRKVGAKMVVAGDGRLFGTVGGGAVEARVVERARALLVEPAVERLEWELASDDAGNMVCGGWMELLLEPFGARPRAFVFGAGHCGLALAPVLAALRFDVTVIDDRADLLAPERLPGARTLCGELARVAAELDLPARAFCIIATRSHRFDLDVMRALVRRPTAYLGLMASRKKRGEVFAALAAEGVPQADLDRVKSPIGLAIGAETPEEIAVAIAAEMIGVLRKSDA